MSTSQPIVATTAAAPKKKRARSPTVEKPKKAKVAASGPKKTKSPATKSPAKKKVVKADQGDKPKVVRAKTPKGEGETKKRTPSKKKKTEEAAPATHKEPRLVARRTLLRGTSSAWILFSNAEREELKKSHPELTFGQQSQILSRKWGDMNEEAKKPFKDLHEADKQRFLADKANLTDDENRMLRQHKRKQKEKKKDKPKAGLSAYMFFVKDNRTSLVANNPGIKFDAIGKRLGEMWSLLPAAEKVPWEIKSAADKQRYERELAVWKEAKDAERQATKDQAQKKREAKEARAAAAQAKMVVEETA